MKHKAIIIILAIVLCAGGFAGWKYYQYNYVEEVTDYYRIEYQPPVAQTYYGITTYTKPEIKIEQQREYESEDAAYDDISKWVAGKKGNLPDMMVKEMEGKDEMQSKIIQQAFQEMMEKEYILMIFTHTRDYDASEYIEKVKEYGINSDKLKDYIEEHHLTVRMRPI